MKLKLLLIFSVIWVSQASPVLASPNMAGKVISVKGELRAINTEKQTRQLKRRSVFYEGDTLKTTTGTYAQIRFSDGALMSLKPDTEFHIARYNFQQEGNGKNWSIGRLIKGSMRTITGVIGKKDPKAYQIITSPGTIGIRGTVYELALQKGLYVAVWRGGVTIKNNTGGMDIGMGSDFNYAYVSNSNTPPQGLLKPPAVFRQGSVTPQKSAKTAQQEATDQSDSTASDTSDDSDSGTTETTTTDSTTTDTDTTDSALDSGDTNQLSTDPVTSSDPTTSTTDTTGISITPDSTIISAGAVDQRLTSAELQAMTFVGLGIYAGANAPAFLGGRATDGSGGSPILTDMNSKPGDTNFATSTIIDVIRQGGAALNASGSNSYYSASWGVWNGTQNPVEIQKDSTDPTVKVFWSRPLFWGTFQLPPLGAITARNGTTVNYSNVLGFIGGGSGGMVTSLTYNADVNFSTGAVTNGSLIITNSDFWSMTFTGNLVGPRINTGGTVSGFVNSGGTPVKGSIPTILIGPNVEAIGGGFDLEAISNPNIFVEGQFTAECSAGPPAC